MNKTNQVKVIVKIADNGEFILFFPGESVNFGNIMSWQEVGEHGEASLSFFWRCKKPRKENELIETERLLRLYRNLYSGNGGDHFYLKRIYKLSYKDRIQAWEEI
jgi:hypothetical protein